MADDKEGSNIWLSAAKFGVSSLGKKIADEAVLPAIASVVCWGMNAAFGLNLQTKDQKEKEAKENLANAVKYMSTELSEIAVDLTVVKTQLNQIVNQIKFQTNQIKQYTICLSLDQAQSDFSLWYTQLCDPADPQNLKRLTWHDAQAALTQANAMVFELGEPGRGQNKVGGLLDLTLQALLQQYGITNDAKKFAQNASVLEGTFLTYTYSIFTGYTIYMNIMLAPFGSGTVPPQPVPADFGAYLQLLPNLTTTGMNAFKNFIQPNVTYLADQYLQTVMLLALSPYQYIENKTPMDLAPASALNAVLGRALLLWWFLQTETYGEAASGNEAGDPGLWMIVFLRPSQVEAYQESRAKGEKSQAGLLPPELVGADVRIFQISEFIQKFWPIVFDFGASPPFETVAASSTSRIVPVLVHRSLPRSTTAIGSPLATSGPLSYAVPQYFSPNLEPIQNQTAPKKTDVLYAFAVDTSQIAGDYWSWKAWNWRAGTYPAAPIAVTAQGNGSGPEPVNTGCSGTIYESSPQQSGTLAHKGDSIFAEATESANLSFDASDAQSNYNLVVTCGWSVNGYYDPTSGACVALLGSISSQLQANTSPVTIYDVTLASSAHLNDPWVATYTGGSQNQSAPNVPVTLTNQVVWLKSSPGQATWTLSINTIWQASNISHLPGGGAPMSMNGQIGLSNVQMSWDQPISALLNSNITAPPT